MRAYSTDLTFMAYDSQVGKASLESTLALVNDSSSTDEEADEVAKKFLSVYNLDFHSEDRDVPRELPVLYEDKGERTQLTIYSPRDGYIKDITENPEASEELRKSIIPKGKDRSWMYFSSTQTDYSVAV